jgi:hypothetical protein
MFGPHIIILKVFIAALSRIHHEQLQKTTQWKHNFLASYQLPVELVDFLVKTIAGYILGFYDTFYLRISQT